MITTNKEGQEMLRYRKIVQTDLQISPALSALRCRSKDRGTLYDGIVGICCHFCRYTKEPYALCACKQKKLCGEEDCERCGYRDVTKACAGQKKAVAEAKIKVAINGFGRIGHMSSQAASSGQKRAVAKIKVAINGFGRIGRNLIRCWHGRKASPLDVIAINDTGGVKQASHLLQYDSMLGTFEADVKAVGDNSISVDGKVIKVVSDRNPLNLLWGALGIDLVIEGTGVFVDAEGAGKHLSAGANKVLITAPGKGAIATYVVGVNEEKYSSDEPIISNASCTTNCLAPFVKVLDEKFGN